MIGNHSKYSYIAESVSLQLNVFQRTIAKENSTFDENDVWLFQAVLSSDKRTKGFVHAGTVDCKARITTMTSVTKVFGEANKYCQEVRKAQSHKIMPLL